MKSRKRAVILILISALCLSGCGKEVHETAFTDSIAPEDYGLEMETVPISILTLSVDEAIDPEAPKPECYFFKIGDLNIGVYDPKDAMDILSLIHI